MKVSAVASLLLVASASAFAPSTRPNAISIETSTSLGLFGGKKEGGGGGGGGGMMDQLAMFKKAQEVAKKKNELDKELQAVDTIGSAADGNVKVTVKYVPPQLPANPNPGYDVVSVDIDESYLGEVSAEDLSAALVDAIRDGETQSTVMVAEKYQELQSDMTEMLQGMQK
eukprot:CAMPEP_0197466908 /NCGR_PEP_ID=MMETSP1175-20131217/65295_1 /TAXON_ID=1003142 /ORGANISM="Triceratium dubium, Strain CCMP147" /LENGTH=169 /DNA_ID=CAMNT_0043002965 /DNA_START=62 /DNA_END=571 /DNA_ORIENTATION=-